MPCIKAIVPAHNEELTIADCLRSLISSNMPSGWSCEIDVVANGCTDRTVEIAELLASDAAGEGKKLKVIELPDASKPNALNCVNSNGAHVLVYVDADVCVSPMLLGQLIEILDVPLPRYASGRVDPVCTGSLLVRRYAEVWAGLPYAKKDVPGCGLFAVNHQGRERWGKFPPIIADDMFARLQFKPHERFATEAPYRWPLPQRARDLIRIQSRWKRGNAELKEKYPTLLQNEATGSRMTAYTGIALRSPFSFVIYSAICVAAAVRRRKRRMDEGWARAPRVAIGAFVASRSRPVAPGALPLNDRCP